MRSRLMLLGSFFKAMRSVMRPGSPGLSARFGAVPRLLRATASGRYRGLSLGRLALVALAIVYVVSPVDLIPEVLVPILGLADDAVVLAWLAAVFVRETESYLAWEQEQASGTAGRSAPQPRSMRSTVRSTVPGVVVHEARTSPRAG